MNIFYLSHCAKTCALYHCDKHVVKMILEYAQILCTTHRVLDGSPSPKTNCWIFTDEREKVFYKSTHVNHPSVVWTRQSVAHYKWLWSLFVYLCQEYTFRYNKTHLCWNKLEAHLKHIPANIPRHVEFTPPPLAMPEHCKIHNHSAVASYRAYYILEKRKFCNWTNRRTPSWFMPTIFIINHKKH